MLKKIDILGIEVDNYTVREAMMQVENYLDHMTYGLLIGVVEERAEGLNVGEEEKKFIADFYKYAFVGIMLNWIKNDMKEDPKDIIDKLSVLISGDITRALKKYAN